MSEKQPNLHNGNKKENGLIDSSEETLELAAFRQVIIDASPEAEESEEEQTDDEKKAYADRVHEHRRDLLLLSNSEILDLGKKEADIWLDPAYAEAVIDVINDRIVRVV